MMEVHDGIRIHFTERSTQPEYGERVKHPDTTLAQGYIEVFSYQIPELQSEDEAWFVRQETPGGASSSSLLRTKEDAIAKAVEKGLQFIGYTEEKVALKEAGDKTSTGLQVIRAGGHHFVIGPKSSEPRAMLGFGGRKFRFKMLATGEVIESNNVWSSGEIPSDYKEKLPDNAEMLEGMFP